MALATGLAAVSVSAGTAGSGGRPAEAGFRLADGSVGCRLVAPERLACRAAGADAAAILEAGGGSSPGDAVVPLDATVPVLLPAESWWNGPFRCRIIDGTAITCSARGGAVTVAPDGLGGVL